MKNVLAVAWLTLAAGPVMAASWESLYNFKPNFFLGVMLVALILVPVLMNGQK